MTDVEFLETLKKNKISQEDILKLLTKEGKLKDLRTQEEIDAENKPKETEKEKEKEKPKESKKEKKKKEKEKEKEAEEEEAEVEDDEKFNKMADELEERITKSIQKSLKIPGKTPSKGKEVDAGSLPEGARAPVITTNKFEVRV